MIETISECPLVIVPRIGSAFESLRKLFDESFTDIKITKLTTEGSEICVYKGPCNFQDVDANNNYLLPPGIEENINYLNESTRTEYIEPNESQVWIGPNFTPIDIAFSQECDTGLTFMGEFETYGNINEEDYSDSESVALNGCIDPAFNINEIQDPVYGDARIHNENFINDPEETFNSSYKPELFESLNSNEKHDFLCTENVSTNVQPVIAIADSSSMSPECVDIRSEQGNISQSSGPKQKQNQNEYEYEINDQLILSDDTFEQLAASQVESSQIIHDSNSSYACTKCERKFKSLEKLNVHYERHGNPELECEKCHKVFATKYTLRTHGKIHLRKYTCKCCSKTFNKLKEVKAHTKKMHSTYTCNIAHNFQNQKSRISVKEFSDSDLSDSQEIEVIDQYEEEYVHRSMNYLEADKVIDKILANKLFTIDSKSKKYRRLSKTCNICPKNFTRINDLKRHLIEHLVQATFAKYPMSKKPCKNIPCVVCKKKMNTVVFNRIDTFKLHLRNHAQLPLYRCLICKKTFSDSSNYSKHKKIHGKDTLQCDICKRKFNSKVNMQRHIEYHKNNEPMPCDRCGIKFYFPSELKRHMKTFCVEKY